MPSHNVNISNTLQILPGKSQACETASFGVRSLMIAIGLAGAARCADRTPRRGVATAQARRSTNFNL